MRVYRSPAEVPQDFGPSVVTIGNFDGVHNGHREILRRVVEIAERTQSVPTVLTFDPHPARVLAPDRAPKLIATIAQRLRRFEEAGVRAVLLLPFSLEFAKQTPEGFALEILANTLKANCVLVGEDFRFGYKQSGDIATLRELGARFGFALQPVQPILGRGERISSSAIRKLVEAGHVSKACRAMGTPFALEGPVVKGQGIGSKQTVPTLNLAPENELLPKTGVYVTRTQPLELYYKCRLQAHLQRPRPHHRKLSPRPVRRQYPRPDRSILPRLHARRTQIRRPYSPQSPNTPRRALRPRFPSPRCPFDNLNQ